MSLFNLFAISIESNTTGILKILPFLTNSRVVFEPFLKLESSATKSFAFSILLPANFTIKSLIFNPEFFRTLLSLIDLTTTPEILSIPSIFATSRVLVCILTPRDTLFD